MEGLSQKKFSSPEEELAFLRAEIAKKELEVLERNKELDSHDTETIGKEVVSEYSEHAPEQVLTKGHALDKSSHRDSVATLETSTQKVTEILDIAMEKGVRNALSVLEKLGDAFLTDEVHRELVKYIHAGKQVAHFNEKGPVWKVLHMTLFEVSLPRHKTEGEEMELQRIFSAMEQFFSGMQTITTGKEGYHYTIELAVSDKNDEIIFYVAVPNDYVNLFEKQALSLFPHAVLTEQQNDYNIFVEGGSSLVSVLKQKKHPAYPIRTHESFDNDPLSVLLNALSKIETEGGGASIQFTIAGGTEKNRQSYQGIIGRIEDGDSVDVAVRKSSIGGELFEGFKDMLVSKKADEDKSMSQKESEALELFKQKLQTPSVDTNVRLVVSSKTKERAEQILTEIESSFRQFENPNGNAFTFKRASGTEKARAIRSYSFREFSRSHLLQLSFDELTTCIHFPAEGIESSPQFKQSRAKHAPAPTELPKHGTLLGVNDYRNTQKEIYLTPEDRLRHFYVIGQTGTGKSTLLKNMVVQDIKNGAGVCMIDPHGTDIVDVLSAVPPERLDDVIYFDPSNLDQVMGLNMLEYDPRFPEQKTFVVNELFSIFQKLYGANPESMGPMFEQYFRNATLLVLEDSDSGSTLLDVSRVMADAEYRAYKLSKATNPVVVQFWKEIASKAGGEASLQNIVPYIVSKFDVFTANDYMRPIIGQQRSAFNFREMMDTNKILLVNLSKGRLGEINANLIGMIIVGKILMATLSRVDDSAKEFPPYYLFIDEFQNVTTDSIATILSEARKYKLGLTMAHQFIAQLDEKIRDAVFGNVGSMAAFRVGTDDAKALVPQFEPTFSESDLVNIENRNAYIRLLADGSPTAPFSFKTLKPDDVDMDYALQVIEYSVHKYGRTRDEVDREIKQRYLS